MAVHSAISSEGEFATIFHYWLHCQSILTICLLLLKFSGNLSTCMLNLTPTPAFQITRLSLSFALWMLFKYLKSAFLWILGQPRLIAGNFLVINKQPHNRSPSQGEGKTTGKCCCESTEVYMPWKQTFEDEA